MSEEIFDSIFTIDNANTLNLANDILQSKAFELIQQRKYDVAQNIFTQVGEEE